MTTSHQWSEGKGRFIFLDLYRGIIVLLMLEGHVVREVLLPELRSTTWFRIHEIIHGITAAGFLFGSGFAFAIATQRRWDQAITFNKNFLRRIWRTILLILIGYALHVPYLSLEKSLAVATEAEWNKFLAFDVLQCIGFGLLILRLLLFLLKDEKIFLVILSIFLISIVYSTPYVSTLHHHIFLPRPIVAALTNETGSYFPLFPYVGFLFAGTIVSWLFLRAAQKQNEHIFIRKLLLVGIFIFIVGYCFELLPYKLYSTYNFWQTCPNYFLICLGILLVMMSIIWLIEDLILSRKLLPWIMPRWITMMGMQSLFIYISHLFLLYGWVYNTSFNINYFLKDSLYLPEALLLTTAFILLMSAGAYGWRFIQKHHPIIYKGLLVYFGIVVVWPFLFSPF